MSAPFLTITEAAATLRLDPVTLSALAAGGDLAAFKMRSEFRLLDESLSGRLLHTITRDQIDGIGGVMARGRDGVSATRYVVRVGAVLKRAAGPWQWIEKAPGVTLYPEAKRRVRW